MGKFNGYGNFGCKLLTGSKLEHLVKARLEVHLKGYSVELIPQDPGAVERDEYSLCDVVVFRDDVPVFGVECKTGFEKFRKCSELYGWDGDYNTPLNGSSLNKYRQSGFPFYILNVNTWLPLVLVARMDKVLESPNEPRLTCYKDNYIYNFDSRGWFRSGKLDKALEYIIGRELC